MLKIVFIFLFYFRYLATGDSYKSLSYDFRIGVSTIHSIIPECLDAIFKVLQPNYLKSPSEERFLNISENFIERWNFPNCVGAIDGKHVRIRAPKHSGSAFFNYKKFHSIVLFAVVDAHANFIYIDVGAYGSQSDGGILWNSSFGKALNDGKSLLYIFVGLDSLYSLIISLYSLL